MILKERDVLGRMQTVRDEADLTKNVWNQNQENVFLNDTKDKASARTGGMGDAGLD